MPNNKWKMLLPLAGVLAVLPILASAETVIEEVSVIYDGERRDPVNSAAVDIYGNMYLTGGRGGVNGYFTAKYDSYGREKWVRTHITGQSSWYGPHDTMIVDRESNAYVALSESYNFGKVLKYDADGNETVLVAGGSISGNISTRIGLALDKTERNLYLRAGDSIQKISLEGGTGWIKQLHYWNTKVRDITVDDSGNIYALGETRHNTGNNSSDIVVKKFDSEGNVLWSQFWQKEGSQNEMAYGIELDSSDNAYILVHSVNNESSCLYCVTSSVVSISSDGGTVNSVVLNGTDGYLAGDIKVAADKVYVTIRNRSTSVLTAQKLNADLSLAWSTEYSSGSSVPLGLDVDGLGNIIVGIRGQNNMATVKFDMYGNELWTQNFDGNHMAFVKFGITGEFYVAGSKGTGFGASYNTDAVMYRYGVTQLVCQ